MIKIRRFESKAQMRVENQNELASLFQSLLELWKELGVQEFYQNMRHLHFNLLPEQQAIKQVRKQIKSTRDQTSTYFEIFRRLSSRKQSLMKLTNLIEKNNKNSVYDGQILSEICNQLKLLRNDNLVVAENLLQLHKQCIPNAETVTDEFKAMLINLDSENTFLKKSFLNELIIFNQCYDPFFLQHYQKKGRLATEYSQSLIDQLFSLSISFSGRLYKTQTKIMNLLSSKQGNCKEVEKRVIQYQQNLSTISNEDQSRVKIHFKIRNKKDEARQCSIQNRRRFFSLKRDKQHQQSGEIRIHRQKYETLNSSPNISAISSKHTLNAATLQLKSDEDINLINKNINSNTIEIEERCEELMRGRKRKYMMNRLEDGNSASAVLPTARNYRIKRNIKRHLEGELPTSMVTLQSQTEAGSTCSYKYKRLNPLQKNHRLRTILPKPIQLSDYQQITKPVFFNNEEQKIEPNDAQNQSIKQTVKIQSKLANSQDLKSTIKRQIKMKPGKYTFSELINHFKSLKFKPQVAKAIFSSKWQQFLLKCQSYICQFILNGKLVVVAICIILPEGDYLIKLWAPTSDCDEQTSIYLFQKYVDYLFKISSMNELFFTGDEIQQILACKFLKKKQRLYSLFRQTPATVKQQEYPNFLSLRCSNFLFPQTVPFSMFFSQQIEAFTKGNSYISLPLANIAKTDINDNLLMLVKINEQISGMKALNSLLIDEQFDTYQTTSQLNVCGITIMRISLDTHFKIPFIAGQGYFKFNGQEVYKAEKQLICRINCEKNHTKLIFGQGFTNIQQFIFNMRKKEQASIQFSVKMFSKQLYGSIPHEGVRNGCYGNWQVTLSWQDQLQGRLKHCMTDCPHFGPQSFFVGIEIEGELLYCFQVKEQDFLF